MLNRDQDLDQTREGNHRVSRWIAVVACVSMVIVCLTYAFFRSQLPNFWRGHGGGIPYVMFWITAWFVVFPKRAAITPIAWFVTLFTCGLEFFQLVHPSWLKPFVATKFGAALLGSGFDWKDFTPYLIGGILGWLLLIRLCEHSALRRTNKPTSQRSPRPISARVDDR